MRLLVLLLVLGTATAARAQPVPASAAELLDALASARGAGLDGLWDALVATQRVPFVSGDTAVFLARGPAGQMSVAGDPNGWNPWASPMREVAPGVWARVDVFDARARLDYKLVRDGTEWALDPHNPHVQWSGHGPNSELRMPAWRPAPETVPVPGAAAGTLGPPQQIESAALGATITYRVYTPPGYGAAGVRAARHPTLYVTDGHEYADDRLGAVPTVLDALARDGRIDPPVAVFIDPRRDGLNRRQTQYVQNPRFADFVATELVPTVDRTYRTRADAGSRVILGTSLGGVFSTSLGVRHADVFGRLAIQSPAYWVSENPEWWSGPSIYDEVAAVPEGTLEVFMSTGTINDTEAGARRMRDTLLARGHTLTYVEVPEGHSWGNWRALIDDVAEALLPPRSAASTAAEPPEPGPLQLGSIPGPRQGLLTVTLVPREPGRVRVRCLGADGSVSADRWVHARGPVPHTVRLVLRGEAEVCVATQGPVTDETVVASR